MIFNSKKNKNRIKQKRDGRVNPHHFWNVFLVIFLLTLTLAIVGFTYFFIQSSRLLDKEVAPKLDVNTSQINKIKQSIEKTEKAVSERVNGQKSSQNDSSIVQ